MSGAAYVPLNTRPYGGHERLLALAGSNVGDQLGAIRIAVIPGTTTEQMVKNAIASQRIATPCAAVATAPSLLIRLRNQS